MARYQVREAVQLGGVVVVGGIHPIAERRAARLLQLGIVTLVDADGPDDLPVAPPTPATQPRPRRRKEPV